MSGCRADGSGAPPASLRAPGTGGCGSFSGHLEISPWGMEGLGQGTPEPLTLMLQSWWFSGGISETCEEYSSELRVSGRGHGRHFSEASKRLPARATSLKGDRLFCPNHSREHGALLGEDITGVLENSLTLQQQQQNSWMLGLLISGVNTDLGSHQGLHLITGSQNSWELNHQLLWAITSNFRV